MKTGKTNRNREINNWRYGYSMKPSRSMARIDHIIKVDQHFSWKSALFDGLVWGAIAALVMFIIRAILIVSASVQ